MSAEEVQGQLERGLAEARDGRWEEARQTLAGVAAADPACFEAWLWLGALAERPAESVAHLQRALALRPASIRAHKGLEWARARLAAIEPPAPAPVPAPEAAAAVVEEIREEAPATAVAEAPAAAAAEAPAAAGDEPPGVLGEGVSFEPETVDWDSIMARLRVLDREPSTIAADRAAPAAPTAGETMVTAVADPAGKGNGAAPAVEERAQAPAAAVAGPEPGYDELLDQGKAQLDGGDYDRAIGTFRRALAIAPASLEARDQLGVALYRSGQLEAALATFEAIVVEQPDQAEAHANIGFLLAELGRVDEAIAAFQTTLTLDFELVEAHLSLGDLLRARGDVPGAIAAWQRTLGLRPGLTDVHTRLADLLLESGQPQEAAWQFRLAIDQRPADADLYLGLARSLIGTGRSDEAVRELEAAARLQPPRADVHAELGRLLDERGQTEAALAHLERALAVDSGCRPAAERIEAIRQQQQPAPAAPPARRGLFGLFR